MERRKHYYPRETFQKKGGSGTVTEGSESGPPLEVLIVKCLSIRSLQKQSEGAIVKRNALAKLLGESNFERRTRYWRDGRVRRCPS